MNINEYLEKNPNVGRRKLSKIFNIPENQARKIVKNFKTNQLLNEGKDELVQHAVKLELKNQRLRDTQRIERKVRSEYRETNQLTDLTNELINCVENKTLPTTIKHINNNKNESVGIFQCSDFHLNEIIDTPNNTFDFKIAAKRLQKFVSDSIPYFQLNNVNTVVFAMTGDMINSDRRIDEKLSLATSRARACYLASILIEQMILELNRFFNVKVAFVVGNESRAFDIGRTDIIMSDNYDLSIVSMLKLIFRDSNIEFLPSNLVDCILNIKGKNVLLLHGDKINGKNMQKSIQEIKGKYTQSGIIIDYVIFGHIHEANNGDFYSRSSSLSGGNGYSEYDLNFSSRASQNIHLVNDEWINSIKIDLQNTNNIEGYFLDSDLIDSLNECKDDIKVNVVKI